VEPLNRRRSGHEWRCPCPIHNGKDDDFSRKKVVCLLGRVKIETTSNIEFMEQNVQWA
jgi:hypothetical protein